MPVWKLRITFSPQLRLLVSYQLLPLLIDTTDTTVEGIETVVRKEARLRADAPLKFMQQCPGSTDGMPRYVVLTLPTLLAQLARPEGPAPGFLFGGEDPSGLNPGVVLLIADVACTVSEALPRGQQHSLPAGAPSLAVPQPYTGQAGAVAHSAPQGWCCGVQPSSLQALGQWRQS